MKAFILLAALVIGGFSYYQQQSTSIDGRWKVNLAKMQERAKAKGLSDQQIQQMNDSYVGGIMDISAERMQMSLAERPTETLDLPYTIVEKDGECTSVKSENQIVKHCLEDGFLVTYDPSTPIIAVHERI